MSTFTPVRVHCRKCGAELEVELLEGIHITRLPEVRAQILAGTFQVFPCPSCAASVRVENDTIYTDFAQHHYVAVQASVFVDWRSAKAEQAQVFTDTFDGGPDIARELGEQFTHRLVPDVAALREKLLVWDAGLDDRVVEAVKGGRQRELGIDHASELWRVSAVLDGGHLLFARLRPLDGRGFELLDHVTVAHDEYARWSTGDALDWEFSALLDDWVVDLFVLHHRPPGEGPPDIPPGARGRHWQYTPTDAPQAEPSPTPPPASPTPGQAK